jgi:hypothetical protein
MATRTAEQKKKDQDKRLQKKYGITLANRDERVRQQGSKCKICCGPLDPPCVDHFHFRVVATRAPRGGWFAVALDENGNMMNLGWAKAKATAIADAKRATMPWAIRGILCRHCNRALGMLERWFDAARHPDHVLPSLEYLRNRLKIT